MAKQQTITETAALQATPVEGKPGRLLVTLITPGQGSSGFYSPQVLEAAGADKVFPAGTQMFLDHPTESEQVERPERSIKDLGAVLAEDARWDDSLQALVAEADTFSQHRELLTEMQEHIGASVRAAAEVSEARGTRTVERLIASPANTCDFVTRAGRGGSFRVLESARPSLVIERALRHDGISEATVNDQREALDDVLKAAHGGEDTYVWLRDFDEETAWFEVSTGGTETTYSQAYTTGENGLADAMTGERTEVRQVTQYVPVNPAGRSTESHRGDDMGTTQIEESALSELREAAGRVTALESERDTALRERDEARAERDELREAAAVQNRETRARELVNEAATAAELQLNDIEIDGLIARLPVTESNGVEVLDESAFTEAVNSKLTKLAESGRVRGFGGDTSQSGAVSEADFDAEFKKEA